MYCYMFYSIKQLLHHYTTLSEHLHTYYNTRSNDCNISQIVKLIITLCNNYCFILLLSFYSTSSKYQKTKINKTKNSKRDNIKALNLVQLPSVRLCLAYSLLNNYYFTHFIQPPANFAKAQQIKLIKKHKVLEQDQRQHNSLCVIFNAQYLL